MEQGLKDRFNTVCNELGLSVPLVVSMLAQAMTEKNELPEGLDPFYSPSNMKAIEHSIKQYEEGKTVTYTLDELRAME